MHIIPTILCGGAGSRLWPVSRELHPKPFIKLSDGESLLQKAFKRGAAIPKVTEILTVTNRELFFKIQDEYRDINPLGIHTSFILEPVSKNTTAAIAASAISIAKKYGDDAILLILAADHLIENQDAFQSAVAQAINLAQAHYLVTFGIEPQHPETGYGYIEANISEPLSLTSDMNQPDGYRVHAFVEKPAKELAVTYVESGNYLWNSGMFCFTVGDILKQLQTHCPEILTATHACIDASSLQESETASQLILNTQFFEKVPELSIDYAVMEPAAQSQPSTVAVVPCNIGWSDIGSWRALGDLSSPDAAGNRIDGEALLHETKNCYIQSNDRLVGAVGLEDIIIIDTPDALLVANKQKAQEVRHVYAELKARGHDAHKLHRTVHRPWGTYTVLEEGTNFKIKRIEVKPGARLSLQMHHHRSEHWIVVSGMALVTNGEQEMLVGTNQSTYIPAGHRHRLENPGVLNLVMIEVQSGEYLGEDDIIRFEDNYGRI